MCRYFYQIPDLGRTYAVTSYPLTNAQFVGDKLPDVFRRADDEHFHSLCFPPEVEAVLATAFVVVVKTRGMDEMMMMMMMIVDAGDRLFAWSKKSARTAAEENCRCTDDVAALCMMTMTMGLGLLRWLRCSAAGGFQSRNNRRVWCEDR